MTDEHDDRPSRQGWPDRRKPPDFEYAPVTHAHELSTGLRVVLIIIGVYMLLITAGLGLVAFYSYQDHEYVMGRGEYRDLEATRQDDQFRQGICDVLDGLPESRVLEGTRNKYGCGPGIPVDQLPPEVANELAFRAPPEPPARMHKDPP